MHIRHFCGNRGDILLVLITYDVNTENEAEMCIRDRSK